MSIKNNTRNRFSAFAKYSKHSTFALSMNSREMDDDVRNKIKKVDCICFTLILGVYIDC